MDKPISVGDLVMIVRPSLCCGNFYGIGRAFTVQSIAPGTMCVLCGRTYGRVHCIGDSPDAVDIRRLKRLDPDALKDDVPTREELTA